LLAQNVLEKINESLVIFFTGYHIPDEGKQLLNECIRNWDIGNKGKKENDGRRYSHSEIKSHRGCPFSKTCLARLQKKETNNVKKRNTLEAGQKYELAFPDQETHGPGYQEPPLQPRKKMHVHLIFRLFSSW
jgi:hypothetical protein